MPSLSSLSSIATMFLPYKYYDSLPNGTGKKGRKQDPTVHCALNHPKVQHSTDVRRICTHFASWTGRTDQRMVHGSAAECFQPPNLALSLVRIEHGVKARPGISNVDCTSYCNVLNLRFCNVAGFQSRRVRLDSASPGLLPSVLHAIFTTS
jgi:hypothetical protein